MIFSLPYRESASPATLKLDKHFQPCLVEPGDEHFCNGIFCFNISRILAYMDTEMERFAVELVALAEIPDYGGGASLDETAVCSADLSRPILLAEISPGRYNLIDGNHRVARARRDRVTTVPARRIDCPLHVPFLTSTLAYVKYIEYWNSKPKEMQPAKARTLRRRA
jgi:hypothetical protein